MTNEEARLTLQENLGYLSEEHPRIIEAMKVAMNILSQPSLPSNLDEAAEECTYCEHAYARESFKEGAEWMAGQGVYADAGVCKLADRAWVTALDEKLFQKEVYDKFKAGDEVVVQIRKK